VNVNVKLALFSLVVLAPSLAWHEFAHAWAALRLGDATPRQWGRMTLNLKPHVDRFGTLLLPALLLILVAAGYFPPVFAYAKPMPLNPSAMRNPDRGLRLYALAGPGANLIVAVIFGLALRATGAEFQDNLTLFLFAGMLVNVVLFVFNLLPIPGLDGAKIVATFLTSYRARQVYQNLDEYLPLFILLVFFILSGATLYIVRILGNAVCRLIGVGDCL
jgi:Zn-dependent protease